MSTSACSGSTSSMKERPFDVGQLDSLTIEGDEEPGGKMSRSGSEYGANTDPAVLAIGPISLASHSSLLRYDTERLLGMRWLPLSKRRPDFLDNNDCSGLWIVKKRSDTPVEEDRGGRGDMPSEVHKRRSADPRERVRKESSPGPGDKGGAGAAGVVLSPQRRSFTSGCYIPAGTQPPVVNAAANAKTEAASREQRRIGSGRILQRDMTTVPWERGASVTNNGTTSDDTTNEYSQQPYRPPNAVMRDRNEDRYERRSFGRDNFSTDNKHDKDRNLDRYVDRRDRDDNRRTRYNDRRRNYDKDDEPEWFSGGPTSQLDTIELRGFDEPSPAPASARSNKFVNGKDSARDKSSTSISASDSSVMKSLDASTVSGTNSNSGVVHGSGSSPEPAPPPARSTPTPRTVREENAADENASLKQSDTLERNGLSDQQINDGVLGNDNHGGDFNLEDFLKYDNIPGLLSNGNIDDTSHGSSRFSQWFRRDSPTQTEQQSQQQRLHDNSIHERAINNLIDGDVDQSISISTSEAGHLFAPISPAASSTGLGNNSSAGSLQAPTSHAIGTHNHQGQGGALFNMLQRNQQQPTKAIDSQPSGKFQSVEELEARMRNRAGSGRIPQSQLISMAQMMESQAAMLSSSASQHHQSHHQQQQQNVQQPQNSDAFKRLLAQVSEGHAVSVTNGPMNHHKQPQPMSLLQMLNKSQQAEQVQEQQRQQQQQQQAHIPQDLLYKLLHIQNRQQQQEIEIASKMVPPPPNRHFQPSPIPGDLQSAMSNAQLSRELLSRPEAQAIIRGLKHGELTVDHLKQQISNPGMQSRHRELLVAILNLIQMNPPSPPLLRPPPSSVASQQLAIASHQQQLRVSPLPHNAFPPRIPSPRELQVHTQSIMHKALIKRKLEEQEANFRRKQEAAGSSVQQQGRNTPATVVSPNKQPPLAFTPTSVLRKMTAEKEGDGNGLGMGKSSQPSWPLQQPQPKMPQGRPIVKGNHGGMSGSSNSYQPSSNQDFQSQAYMNHHQQQLMTTIQQQQLQMASRNKMASGNMQISGSQQAQFNSMMLHMQQDQQRQRQLQQQQQHQQMPLSLQSQMNNQSGNPSGLHQLFQMHSQHRGFNELGGRGASMSRDGNSSGALSPTSNQLARWFSPELLAQATAGKLPPVNMAANALSLEELERIQHNSAIVHN